MKASKESEFRVSPHASRFFHAQSNESIGRMQARKDAAIGQSSNA